MYSPPLGPELEEVSTWEYRKSLLKERIKLIDADVVCLQEVSPLSFDKDFAFMSEDLGYDGVELFKKGRFRPATFYRKSKVTLSTDPMHKDRTLLTSFILDAEEGEDKTSWHVLNCHLQAGKNGGRRVRQLLEGVSAAYKASKNKLKGKVVMRVALRRHILFTYTSNFIYIVCTEEDPENLKLIVCGDFNGSKECGAVHLVETASIDEKFLEDGEQVSSKVKSLPIPPLIDAMATGRGEDEEPPATLVVPELISLMTQAGVEDAYANPQFSDGVTDRLKRIYKRFATKHDKDQTQLQMSKEDVAKWLTVINLQVGRGTEFRNAAKYMGWADTSKEIDGEQMNKSERPPIYIPDDGVLTLSDFINVYLDELKQGKFWGIAWDLAALGEPLPISEVFRARYDRMYCSVALQPAVVLDTVSDVACPNEHEPSDHLPVCASFVKR